MERIGENEEQDDEGGRGRGGDEKEREPTIVRRQSSPLLPLHTRQAYLRRQNISSQ
jgi:hypothetical protein